MKPLRSMLGWTHTKGFVPLVSCFWKTSERCGFASSYLFPVFVFLAQKSGLPTNETTFARTLQENGYKTAMIGKWHLGLNCDTPWDGCHGPLQHGFDYYFGLPLSNFRNLGEDGGDMIFVINPTLMPMLAGCFLFGLVCLSFLRKYIGVLAYLLGFGCIFYSAFIYLRVSNLHILNSVLMRQDEVVEQPIRFHNLPERFVREGERFLEQRAQDGAPFLLFMSWDQVHTHMHSSKRFRGKSAHGTYGDEVEEMDWSSGRILDKLDELGLTDNTLVYFSSDNGGHHEEFNEVTRQVEGGHNGIFSGGKAMGGQEGGIRVPTAIMWPGHIPAGVTIDVPTSQMDIFPTLLQITGASLRRDRLLDGRSLLPLLTGRETRSPHRVMFHYCAHWLHAARFIPDTGPDVYKVHWFWPDWLPGQDRCEGFACSCQQHHHELPKPRLYNVARDPREQQPLDLSVPENAAILETVEKLKFEHEANLEQVPDQFGYLNSVYRPWLQPCCNFPHCNCKDPLDPTS